MIKATKAGNPVQRYLLGADYLASGNISKVARAFISAGKANIELNFKAAAGTNLAGRQVFEAVQPSVNRPGTAALTDKKQQIALNL